MSKLFSRLTIVLLFLAAFSLAVLHEVAIEMSWYYFYPWVDIPMHLLGGFVAGLFGYIILATFQVGEEVSLSFNAKLLTLLFVLLVIFAWEIFELIFDLTNDAGLSIETLSDMVLGLVGAAIAWFAVWALEKICT